MRSELLTRFIKRVMRPWTQKIQLMIGRCVIKAVNDSTEIQKLQITGLAGEVKNNVERFQEFGFRSNPPINSESIMACVGGNREHGVIIATEHRPSKANIPDLDEGEVVIYNLSGKFIHLDGDNFDVFLSKIQIRNDAEELITILSDLIQQIRNSRWNTAIGPQPIYEVDGLLLDDIKDRLDTFKI